MTISNDSITIGIPFFNAEKYLELAILSVINQTNRNWLLILVDDGSTDHSLRIAESYQSDKIIIYSDGERKGLPNRLNEIASYAPTRLLARMDADDIMHPSRLEKQLKFLTDRPDVDVVGSGIVSIDHLNNPAGFRNNSFIPGDVYTLLKNRLFYHPTICGKTEWFKKNRYSSDYDRIEDLELWVRTFEESQFYILNEVLLFYREMNIPSLDKYLKTSVSYRKILKNYSIRLSKIEKTILLVKSHLKDIIYRFSYFASLEHYLIQSRNSKLSEAQAVSFKEIISESIKKDNI